MKKNKGYITIAGAIIFSSIIICFSIIANKPTNPSFDHLTINVEKTPAEQIIINNNSNYPDGLFGVKIRTDIKDYLHDKDQLLLNLIYKEYENYYKNYEGFLLLEHIQTLMLHIVYNSQGVSIRGAP